MRSRALLTAGWLLAVPGVILAIAVAAQIYGVAEAAGCRPDRFLAVRCPESLLGGMANDLHDLGTMVLLVPQLAVLPILYAAAFIALRLMAALLRAPAVRGAR